MLWENVDVKWKCVLYDNAILENGMDKVDNKTMKNPQQLEELIKMNFNFLVEIYNIPITG